jgi:hypothetical protein
MLQGRPRPGPRGPSEALPMPSDSREPPPAPEHVLAGQPLAIEALARRKRRDAAVVLPFAGLVLFASPLLDIVAGWGTALGLPTVVLYAFGAWFGLIGLTAWLAPRLSRDAAETESREA